MQRIPENLQYAFSPITNCPVCGDEKRKIIYSGIIHTCNVLKKSGLVANNEDVLPDVYECVNCQHRYLSFVLGEKYINHYYSVAGSEYYDRLKDAPFDRTPKLNEFLANVVAKECPSGSEILEIGSGTGHFLTKLKALNFKCVGVEPNETISEYSRTHFNLEITTGILDYNTYPDRKFQGIVVNDVVEHIYNIDSLFELIQHYLKPGGKVFVLTGNSKSKYARLCGKQWLYFFSWEHISFFNRSSIKYLLGKHNLKLTLFKTIGHSYKFSEEIRNLYYTLTGMIANFLGLRKHKYFYMAFDHFVAVGEKSN